MNRLKFLAQAIEIQMSICIESKQYENAIQCCKNLFVIQNKVNVLGDDTPPYTDDTPPYTDDTPPYTEYPTE